MKSVSPVFSGLLLLVAGFTPACGRASDGKAAPSCSIVAPADVHARPARWLGPCVGGRAQGAGVIRLGSREPYAFFAGEALAGQPKSGLLFDPSGTYRVIMGFDAKGQALIADGEHIKEQDMAWADASRGAHAVAAIFARAGNTGSTAYYRRFADKIDKGRPE